MAKEQSKVLSRQKLEEMRRIAKIHGARRLRVFGSYASGVAYGSSDLDLLVDLEPGRSLLDLVGLKQDLEALLGRKVDVVEEEGLSPYLKERILQEARDL
jgi:predicted nucleotidyltransferase